jgi:hypothetical protein
MYSKTGPLTSMFPPHGWRQYQRGCPLAYQSFLTPTRPVVWDQIPTCRSGTGTASYWGIVSHYHLHLSGRSERWAFNPCLILPAWRVIQIRCKQNKELCTEPSSKDLGRLFLFLFKRVTDKLCQTNTMKRFNRT